MDAVNASLDPSLGSFVEDRDGIGLGIAGYLD
jgi:hypothetical protein